MNEGDIFLSFVTANFDKQFTLIFMPVPIAICLMSVLSLKNFIVFY